MNLRIVLYLLIIAFISCELGPSSASAEIERLGKEYDLQPTQDRADAYLTQANQFIADNSDNYDLVRPVLLKASDISYETKMYSKSAGYLMPLLKEEGSTLENKTNAVRLADLLRGMRKAHAANIIYKGLMEQYPSDREISQLEERMDTSITASEPYLTYLFDQVLVNPNEYGINRRNALKFVDATEAFALIKADHPNTPKYLYQAAEIARSLRTMPKAMNLYDWLLEKYPEHEKSPTVLFIKGFILEQDFKKEDEARKIYEEFIAKYPDHEMASSAQFLLDNMGKSDEEILKSIEEKRDK